MFFNLNFNPYLAVIGDIKESKSIKNRTEVQEKLKSVLRGINKKYAKDFASRLTVTLGDEFQGLLSSGENIIAMIFAIERNMYPTKIRFGIGIGDITTPIDHKLAIGSDGPGYYKAREAIQYLKQNEKKKQSSQSDIRIKIFGGEYPAAELINTILSLMTAIKHSWTDRQRHTIWDMLEHQDSQTKAAKRLGITQSSVQKNLVNGNYYTYKAAASIVQKALSEIRRK